MKKNNSTNQVFGIFMTLALATGAASLARANELILTQKDALEQGYVPVLKKSISTDKVHKYVPYRNDLQWPFSQPYARSIIGNCFHQYQPYTLPGYHLGSDMIQEAGSEIFAPVDGTLEAGHYGYSLLPNGDRIKQWKAWPDEGDPNYFEIAVIDSWGNRFELHHIDRSTLPQEIIEKLNSNDRSIRKGTLVGKVKFWPTPFHYHHIHVNFIDATGVDHNVENIFTLIDDHEKPTVQFYVEYDNGSVELLSEGQKLSRAPSAIIVSGYDKKDFHQYVQAPSLIQFIQRGEVIDQFDARETLLNTSGDFIEIQKVYPEEVILKGGRKLKQASDFYPLNPTNFNIRLKINRFYAGENFEILVGDIAGNTTRRGATLFAPFTY